MENKLILHFDARNTLFVADYKSKLTMEAALNTYMSGLVWGVVENDEWIMKSTELQSISPVKDHISYYKYMEKRIVKTAEDRPVLRQTLGKFTSTHGKKFEPTYLHHLNKLKWNHEHIPQLIVKGNTDIAYHYILPTFFQTVDQLYQTKRDFAIILRTYGNDIPHLLSAIETFLNGQHPDFPQKYHININMSDKTNLSMTDDGYCLQSECPSYQSKSEMDILEHLNSVNGIAAVRDDFNLWLTHNYHYTYSKPLWINYQSNLSNNRLYHHIFFDDCIRPRDKDSIVHLRRFPRDLSKSISNRSEILSVDDTLNLIDVNIVQSELLTCINDKDYFIKKIKLCEENLKLLRCENNFNE